jgi:hypothetical protein
MIYAGKKAINATKIIHSLNHTQVNKCCDINSQHTSLIKTLDFKIGEPIYNLSTGLYYITIDNATYVINIYMPVSSSDYLVIRNKDNISLYISTIPYPIVAYELAVRGDVSSGHAMSNTINDNIDSFMFIGNSTYSGVPYVTSPMSINRITSIVLNSSDGSTNSSSLKINPKHTLGSLPNGVCDVLLINSDNLSCVEVAKTSKEILSGGVDWQYIEEYSIDKYYVFFAPYGNAAYRDDANSIRCSHFEAVSYSTLISTNISKNCIALSYGKYGNGIFIKIAKSVLDIHGDKDFATEMQKWVLAKAVSNYPIYIEYQLQEPIYNNSMLDEYHLKSFYPETTITVTGASGFSIFYKKLLIT